MTGSGVSKTSVCLAVVALLCVAGLILGLVLGRDAIKESKCAKNGKQKQEVQGGMDDKDIPEDKEQPDDEGFTAAWADYRHAAVTSPEPQCNIIGSDMLGRGGSAVDAAIATTVCTGALRQTSSGVGGGHYAVIYAPPRPSEAENPSAPSGDLREIKAMLAREASPAAFNSRSFVNKSETAFTGGLSIAVPGEVSGLYTAWSRYGRLPWNSLFTPTIQMLREGYPFTERVRQLLITYRKLWDREGSQYDNARNVFTDSSGQLRPVGYIIQDPLLARTLERIAEDPFTFYNGSLADDIVADIQEAGGVLSKSDLKSYAARLYDTPSARLHATHGNYTVHCVPPPSGGVVSVMILNIINQLNLNPGSVSNLDARVLTYYQILEAFKFAYAHRSMLGDIDFLPGIPELVKNMTSTAYAEYIRSRINDDTTHNISYYNPVFSEPEDSGTAQVSVKAGDGTAVSLTSSINTPLGSGIKGSRTGIVFNNHMDDFSTPDTVNFWGFPASPANFIAPGKSMQSSMSPMILRSEDTGQPIMMWGSAGGSKIISGTAWVAAHAIWLGESLRTAADHPRLHHQLVPNKFMYDKGFDKDVLLGLAKRGHDMEEWRGAPSVLTAIYDNCTRECGSSCVGVSCVHAIVDGRYITPIQPDGY